ncbi:MAG: DUF1311 domain-containing protein [Paracoccaceae bacterium]|nr:DUF1311 domain-containing protein [Paracoccaceae bacterium]
MRYLAAICLIVLPELVAADDELSKYMTDVPICSSESCVGDAATLCMDTEADGYSTVGMMFCTLAERTAWDDELNAAYKIARDFAKGMDAADMTHFPEYAVRDTQVLEAQRAWITYRDAKCAMEYGLWGAGSMRQIAGASCLLEMTAERVFELRDYVEVMR